MEGCYDKDEANNPLTYQFGINSDKSKNELFSNPILSSTRIITGLPGATVAFCIVCNLAGSCIRHNLPIKVKNDSRVYTEDQLNQIISLSIRNPEETLSIISSIMLFQSDLS